MIEDELFIQCPLVPADSFVSYCKERDLSIDREDLELYEKLGVFYPIARVEFPRYTEKIEYVENRTAFRSLGILREGEVWEGDTREDYGHFLWEKNLAKEFHSEGLLWAPMEREFTSWNNFYDKELMERRIESYYSIFQIFPLYMITSSLSMKISLASWTTYDKEAIDKFVNQLSDVSSSVLEVFNKGESLPNEISLTCQIISNRYHPKTRSDRRTINISYPSHYHDWSWRAYCRKWDAKEELTKMGVNEERIKKYQEAMSMHARCCDPIADWYDLVQFISVDKKNQLQGSALLAQSFYAMELMLRLFYKELSGQELSEDISTEAEWKEKVFGEGIPKSNMLFLEYLTNLFHLNPRPKLILVVEGSSEYQQVPRLAEELGYSFDRLGIRIELLEGIGNFKSEKLERFIDHYHSLQTIVYLILDNENNANQFKNKILRKKSRCPDVNRYITNEDYIFLWDTCFEFDNFSDIEIADALCSIFDDKHCFAESEIAGCRNAFGRQKDPIAVLTLNKTGVCLNKPLLAGKLIDNLISGLDAEFVKGKPKRKLVEKIIEIVKLASRNYQPWSYDLWKKNQKSGFLGKIAE